VRESRLASRTRSGQQDAKPSRTPETNASAGSGQGEEKAFLAARRADWGCTSELREVLVLARLLRYDALQSQGTKLYRR
jgi:hypothetical protein